MKFSSIYLIGLATLSFVEVVYAQPPVPASPATTCNDGPSLDWDVELFFLKIKSTKKTGSCHYRYRRDQFATATRPKAYAEDWTTNDGQTFDVLETRQFSIDKGTTPIFITVDKSPTFPLLPSFRCARALYKDTFRDFVLGTAGSNGLKLDDVFTWTSEPMQITIIAYECDGKTVVPTGAFDAKRSLAIWLSPKIPAPVPGPGIKNCDVSNLSIGDCLNRPYWGVEPKTAADKVGAAVTDMLVYYGSLHLLKETLDAEVPPKKTKKVVIYIPEDYDLRIPITTAQLRIPIASDAAAGKTNNLQDCQAFAANPTGKLPCVVENVEGNKEQNLWTEVFDAQLKIVGLGRISGLKALKATIELGGQPIYRDFFTIAGTYDAKDIVKYQAYVRGNLLSISSTSAEGNFDSGIKCKGGKDMDVNDYAIDVEGVQVAWGSQLGQGAISLNTNWWFSSGADTGRFCARLFDVKDVGNWPDTVDGADIMGAGSFSQFTYSHHNDDTVKIAVDYSTRRDSTVLQGSGGSVVMIGSYGKTRPNGIKYSKVENVYVHRILQRGNPSLPLSDKDKNYLDFCGNYQGTAGLIATRSCGGIPAGLTDFTLNGFYVPKLQGTSLVGQGANSVGQPFGIGVETDTAYCGGPLSGFPLPDYPIRNLKFEKVQIDVEPSCPSRFYDNTRIVKWGTNTVPSVYFYNPDIPPIGKCSTDITKNQDFPEAVVFDRENSNPKDAYLFCGYTEGTVPQPSPCIGNGGTSTLNLELLDYGVPQIGRGPINIEFPLCPATPAPFPTPFGPSGPTGPFGPTGPTSPTDFLPFSSPSSELIRINLYKRCTETWKKMYPNIEITSPFKPCVYWLEPPSPSPPFPSF